MPGDLTIVQPQTRKFFWVFLSVLVVALGYFALDKFSVNSRPEETGAETVQEQDRNQTAAGKQNNNSVAVLPFVNMSSDPEQEFFADGMTEEVLNLLAGITNLRVPARTSSFFFKDKDLPVSNIAQILNVQHVLEGSVRKSGDRVRITAQLIEAGSDRHVWSETYDRELADVFEIQDEVASAIATALVDSFEGLNLDPVSRTDSLAAYEAYRTGRLLWWRRSPEDLQAAIDLFSKAVEYDPGFAPAYAAIADSWVLLVLYGKVQILDGVENARPMIEKALELDADGARELVRGLLRMQPNSPTLLVDLSELELKSGNLAEAWNTAKRAYDQAPENTVVVIAMAKAWIALGAAREAEEVLVTGKAWAPRNVNIKLEYLPLLMALGRTQDAENLIKNMFPEDISWIPAANQRTYHYQVGLLNLFKGDLALAREHLEQALNPDETQLYDDNQITTLTLVSMLSMALGDTDLAEQRLLTAERVVGHARVNGIENSDIYYSVACIFALRGENQRALQALQQAYNKGWRNLWLLENDGRLESIRGEPSLQTLREQLTRDLLKANEMIL